MMVSAIAEPVPFGPAAEYSTCCQYMLSVHVVSTWCTHVHGGVGVEGTCELVLFGGEVVADTNKLPDGWKPRTARH